MTVTETIPSDALRARAIAAGITDPDRFDARTLETQIARVESDLHVIDVLGDDLCLDRPANELGARRIVTGSRFWRGIRYLI